MVAALRAGDAEAFRALVEELHPGLVRLASTYVPRALAEEVVQETWAAVIKSIDSFAQRSALKTWIYRIMLNKVRTLAAREAKILPFAAMGRAGDDAQLVPELLESGHWTASPTPWPTEPGDVLERAEALEMIEKAIAELPTAQREVVELRDVQGWSAAETCNALGISAVNQRVLLHRGRVALRAKLEEYLSSE